MTKTFFEKRVSCGIGDLVENLPGDEHGHDDGLAEPVAILEHSRWKAPPSPGMSMPDAVGCGAFGQPDQRLDGFELAEEEAAILALFRVVPVLEQALGDAGDARIVWPRARP